MRFLPGIVVLMSLTLPGWGEEYFPSRGFHSFTVGQHQSFVEKRTSLWFQPRQKTPRSLMKTAKPFALQVRLTSDDSGFAYIGQGTHTEPEIHGEDLLPSLDPPPPAAEEFTIKPPTGDAVPLDGAAKGTEQKADSTEDKPAENRSSFGWIAGTGNQLGMLEWMGRDLAVVDFSAADRGAFRITGGHEFRWLNGPDSTDLPPYLFSLFVEVGAGIKVGNDWSFDVVVCPSWNTDFANKSYQLFRLPWQAVNTFRLDDEWKLVAGLTDLDREDIQLLPVAGVIYRPLDGSADYNLVFPRPKAAWRLSRRMRDVIGALSQGNSEETRSQSCVQVPYRTSQHYVTIASSSDTKVEVKIAMSADWNLAGSSAAPSNTHRALATTIPVRLP
ncbi:MAG: hypothetical protein U0941_14385 [Planctomycetaceae bacterium]